MSLSGSVSFDFNLADKRAVGLSPSMTNAPRLQLSLNYGDGAGDSQANQLYGVTRTIPGGGNDVVDLNGALTDAFGGSIALVRLKALAIVNPAGNGDLTVGSGTNPETTLLGTTIKVKPNGFFCVATDDATAYAITAGTADSLQVAGTAGQSYQIAFAGSNV